MATPNSNPPADSVNVTALAQAIAAAVQGIAPPRQLTVDEVPPRSSFNPDGRRNRELSRVVYQNGNRLNAEFLHDEEIALLGLLRPGKFVNGLVTVYEQDKGGSVDLHIAYKCGKDDRYALKNEVRNFTELLKRCVSEAESK